VDSALVSKNAKPTAPEGVHVDAKAEPEPEPKSPELDATTERSDVKGKTTALLDDETANNGEGGGDDGVEEPCDDVIRSWKRSEFRYLLPPVESPEQRPSFGLQHWDGFTLDVAKVCAGYSTTDQS